MEDAGSRQQRRPGNDGPARPAAVNLAPRPLTALQERGQKRKARKSAKKKVCGGRVASMWLLNTIADC